MDRSKKVAVISIRPTHMLGASSRPAACEIQSPVDPTQAWLEISSALQLAGSKRPMLP